MKLFTTLLFLSITSTVFAKPVYNGVTLESVDCVASNSTGKTHFMFKEGNFTEGTSVTSNVWVKEVVDHYYKPGLYSANAASKEFGNYHIGFVAKVGTPSQKYLSFDFFFNDKLKVGVNNVDVTLVGGVSNSTLSNPMGVAYDYIGEGTCEIVIGQK